MLADFKEFVAKFNVVPLAVAFILAGAAQGVIDSVVNVLMSLIGKAGGLDVNFDDWNPGDIPLGAFLTALIAFLFLAFLIFLLVRGMKRAGFATDPFPTPDIPILEEIRDNTRK